MTAQPGCMQPYCSERPTLPLTDYKHNTSGDAFYFMQQYISLQNGFFYHVQRAVRCGLARAGEPRVPHCSEDDRLQSVRADMAFQRPRKQRRA